MPLLVGYGDDDGRLLLTLLRAESVPRRVRHVLPLLDRLLFRRLPRLLQSLDLVLEVVGEDGAERRVRGGEERLSEEALLLQAVRGRGDEHPRALHGEDRGFPVEKLLRDSPERGVVVEDVEAAAERRRDEIALALLDGEVANRDDRHPALELDPFLPPVQREEDAELRSREEE